jgi:hypothetical protein
MNDLTTEQKHALISNQIAEWRAVAFNAEVAHRVHKRIGTPAEELQRFVTTMEQAEKAIAYLEEERGALVDVRQNGVPMI